MVSNDHKYPQKIVSVLNVFGFVFEKKSTENYSLTSQMPFKVAKRIADSRFFFAVCSDVEENMKEKKASFSKYEPFKR